MSFLFGNAHVMTHDIQIKKHYKVSKNIIKTSTRWNDLIINFHPDITCNTKYTCRYKYSKHFNSQSFVTHVICWLEPYESCTCIFLETVFNNVISSRITIKLLQYELRVNTDVIAENGRLKWHTMQLYKTTNQWEINWSDASVVRGSTLTHHICL